MNNNIIDLTGKRFGMLTVISISDQYTKKKVTWVCRCDCGNTKVIRGSHMKSGLTRSCGCLLHNKYSKLIGSKVGSLHIIEKIRKDNGRTAYKCMCDCRSVDCKKECIVDQDTIIKHMSGNISCHNTNLNTGQIGRKNIIRNLAINYYYNTIRNNSTTRGIVFDIELRIFHELIKLPCHYCGRKDDIKRCIVNHRIVKLHANGIDRVDNNKGYTIDNCVSCCEKCNMMKKDMTQNNFISHCKLISSFNAQTTTEELQ